MYGCYKRWFVLSLISSVLFLIVIDVTILYTALPQLTYALKATPSEKLWIMNAYPLFVAGLLPLTGALSDKVGHKKMFLLGLPLFGIASLCAAFSPTAMSLTFSRAFLAIGAAMSMPATLAIVRQLFLSPKERALAIGIWSAVASSGAAIGPLIGGFILKYYWWGFIFLINVPIILLIIPLAYIMLPQSTGQKLKKITLWDPIFVLVGLIGILYGLKELSKPQTSGIIVLISGIIGVCFVLIFKHRQMRTTSPLIDFTLFHQAKFSSGIAIAMLSVMVVVGIQLLLSQWLQLVMGKTPFQAALYLLPISIASISSAPITGAFLNRLSEDKFTILGLSCMFVGIAGLASIYQISTGILLWLFLWSIGFGFGMLLTVASSTVMLNAPDEKAGMAASIEEITYEMGSILGVTLMGGLINLMYTLTLILPDYLKTHSQVYNSIDDALFISEQLSPEHAITLINQTALAFNEAFLIVMMTILVILAISLFILPCYLREKPTHKE
ncbi:DHA2 family multidrug resistance protein-like MFS transporter [Providencia alcalifaciens]|uniref:DHA2 family multidrug resistance protein-like MFS transporter n=1 Tax=Providencia alcalifaciens TaxID=126385 RepID=A0A4V6P045_9GAMM|nr:MULTISPECIES: MFS transporter [Providencia]MBC5792245.1 MFS transporter [Providencia sp. JUb39]TCT28447.1 DHA2 family multidrug resistance protein-like MFS transporter [Providencia alcalifaciens]